MQVKYTSDGLASLIFTAEGDMRQAINNLQSTWQGFGLVSPEAVFKVCDLPHPVTINKMISACEKGKIDEALKNLDELWTQGYSAVDIVSTIFRVVKNNETMPEYRKLEFIKVGCDLHAR
jgi:replication factor C subunit 2/4